MTDSLVGPDPLGWLSLGQGTRGRDAPGLGEETHCSFGTLASDRGSMVRALVLRQGSCTLGLGEDCSFLVLGLLGNRLEAYGRGSLLLALGQKSCSLGLSQDSCSLGLKGSCSLGLS